MSSSPPSTRRPSPRAPSPRCTRRYLTPTLTLTLTPNPNPHPHPNPNQVHTATLKANNQRVAIKVQHPRLAETLPIDMWLLRGVASLSRLNSTLKVHPTPNPNPSPNSSPNPNPNPNPNL